MTIRAFFALLFSTPAFLWLIPGLAICLCALCFAFSGDQEPDQGEHPIAGLFLSVSLVGGLFAGIAALQQAISELSQRPIPTAPGWFGFASIVLGVLPLLLALIIAPIGKDTWWLLRQLISGVGTLCAGAKYQGARLLQFLHLRKVHKQQTENRSKAHLLKLFDDGVAEAASVLETGNNAKIDTAFASATTNLRMILENLIDHLAAIDAALKSDSGEQSEATLKTRLAVVDSLYDDAKLEPGDVFGGNLQAEIAKLKEKQKLLHKGIKRILATAQALVVPVAMASVDGQLQIQHMVEQLNAAVKDIQLLLPDAETGSAAFDSLLNGELQKALMAPLIGLQPQSAAEQETPKSDTEIKSVVAPTHQHSRRVRT